MVASRTFWPTRSYWDRNWWVHSRVKLTVNRNLQFSCRDCSKNQLNFGPCWGPEWVQQQGRSCRSSSWSIINFHFNRSNGNCVTVITSQTMLLLYVTESLPQHLLRGFSEHLIRCSLCYRFDSLSSLIIWNALCQSYRLYMYTVLILQNPLGKKENIHILQDIRYIFIVYIVIFLKTIYSAQFTFHS